MGELRVRSPRESVAERLGPGGRRHHPHRDQRHRNSAIPRGVSYAPMTSLDGMLGGAFRLTLLVQVIVVVVELVFSARASSVLRSPSPPFSLCVLLFGAPYAAIALMSGLAYVGSRAVAALRFISTRAAFDGVAHWYKRRCRSFSILLVGPAALAPSRGAQPRRAVATEIRFIDFSFF